MSKLHSGKVMRKWMIPFIALLSLCSRVLLAQSSADSLLIEGKSYTLHKVQKGETLYSVCNKYKVEMTEVVTLNRIGGSGYTLNAGDLLIIPLYAKKPLIDVKNLKVSDDGYITHVVKQGETLFSISRNYNGVTPQMLREKNNLKSDTLKINQQLLIPQEINARAVYKEEKKEHASSSATASAGAGSPATDYERKYKAAETSSSTIEVSRGIATWLDNSSDENQKNFYALHKYAPIGSLLKVRNLMNNRTAFVKVIGKLPDNEANRNIVITLSAAAARELRVLDAKFLAEVTIPEK